MLPRNSYIRIYIYICTREYRFSRSSRSRGRGCRASNRTEITTAPRESRAVREKNDDFDRGDHVTRALAHGALLRIVTVPVVHCPAKTSAVFYRPFSSFVSRTLARADKSDGSRGPAHYTGRVSGRVPDTFRAGNPTFSRARSSSETRSYAIRPPPVRKRPRTGRLTALQAPDGTRSEHALRCFSG